MSSNYLPQPWGTERNRTALNTYSPYLFYSRTRGKFSSFVHHYRKEELIIALLLFLNHILSSRSVTITITGYHGDGTITALKGVALLMKYVTKETELPRPLLSIRRQWWRWWWRTISPQRLQCHRKEKQRDIGIFLPEITETEIHWCLQLSSQVTNMDIAEMCLASNPKYSLSVLCDLFFE